MSLTEIVSVSITSDTVGVTRPGYGKALLLSYNAAFAERSRSYGSLAEVAVDFPSTTGPEYLFAQAYFSQSPKPEQLMIGRGALKPTQVYTLTPVVQNTHEYVLRLKGDGATSTEVSFTSDGTATDVEICTGLVTAINAVVGKNFTAANGGGTLGVLTITANAAGEWFSVEVDAIADWTTNSQTHVDPGVATDLAAIELYDASWYALATVYNSKAYTGAAAAWVESNKKLYLFDVADLVPITVAVASADDALEDIFDLAYARSSGWYHHDPASMLAGAVYGKCLPFDPGEETWALQPLSAIAASPLTTTHKNNLKARRANWYSTYGGIGVTTQGKVPSTAKGYIDVVRSLDWVESEMSADIFATLAAVAKIPFTNAGIAMIENRVRGVMERAEAAGIFAPGWTVTVPDVADVSAADKADRILPDVKFSATLAGAVHSVEVAGVISL